MGLNFEAKSKNTILVGNISNSVGNPNIHPPLSCKSQLTRFEIIFLTKLLYEDDSQVVTA